MLGQRAGYVFQVRIIFMVRAGAWVRVRVTVRISVRVTGTVENRGQGLGCS